jgi:3-deoxy-D-manno-octulosonic-acid transferase
LLNEILKQYPQIHVLLTSGTVTSAKEIAKKLRERTIHQFVPVDKFFAVKRFISHWQPDFVMFVESEIWPNLITITKNSGCKLALVNGRISEKSYKSWLFWHKIGFNILHNFDYCFAQSTKDQGRFQKLGLKNVYFEGNLKSVCTVPNVDLSKLEYLREKIGNRKIWLSSSTHAGEEEIIIQTHFDLKKFYPDILTILAPRHPVRKKEILALIPGELNVAARSDNAEITNSTDIYLADTLGELGLFYSLAKVAFIGGSLKENIGGHTPFEALKSGCAPVSGPYVDNFEEIYQQLANNQACVMVKDQTELMKNIAKLISDFGLCETILENGLKVIKQNDGVIERIMSLINLKQSKI